MKKTSRKKVIMFLGVWLCCCAGAWAQKISVLSFAETLNDRDAVHFKKEDINGNTCALIKVVTTQKGFKFDIGSMVPEFVEEKDAEIWVYVPAGTKRIKIRHNDLGQLMTEDGFYWFNQATKAATTYRLVLSTAEIKTIVEDAVTQQYLTVYLEPKDASLEVNGEAWIPDEQGIASKYMEFGEYDYRATAPMYHPYVGKVTVNDPNNTHELRIHMKPNFGFLKVAASSADMNGALVYIDDERIGEVPMTSDRLKSGTHRIRIVKELYKPYEQTISITDSMTTTISPELAPNFAVTTLTAPNNAEIWINGIKKATGHWSGPLEAGTYRFETKLPSHRTAVQTEIIQEESRERKIALRAPDPIYGSVNVTSQPIGATIYIDGKEMGTTPRVIRDVLIGSRKVEIKKTNYSSFTENITVEEGKTVSVTGELSNVAIITVKTSEWESSADIYMDSKLLGKSPHSIEVPCGTHTFSSKYINSDNREWKGETTVNVDNSTPVIIVPMRKLPRNYVKDSHFYLEGGYQFMDFAGYGVALGGYWNNFNAEFGFTMGGDNKDIYWYDQTWTKDPSVITYKANRTHLKVGYGIKVGHRIQVTPQIGGALLCVSSNDKNGEQNVVEYASDTYAVQWISSLRMTCAISPYVQLVVTPEYTGVLKRGALFEKLNAVSEDIKGWGSGFSLRTGLTRYF